MNNRFVYDEKSSSLYAPDGVFLKRLHCPKALDWNQLTVEGSEQRWRNCSQCKERVLNLDVADVDVVVREFQSQWSNTCVHVSNTSDRVIFLKDASAPPRPTNITSHGAPVVIRTVRSLLDIERAVGMGYWPDIHFVEYDTEKIHSKISVGQHPDTGAIETSGDYRRSFEILETDNLESTTDKTKFYEVIPFTQYYQYYQDSPIAAYLIPKSIEDGAKVVVPDPIEDIVGSSWNQGSAYRAKDVRGFIRNRKVVIEKNKVPVRNFIG